MPTRFAARGLSREYTGAYGDAKGCIGMDCRVYTRNLSTRPLQLFKVRVWECFGAFNDTQIVGTYAS